MNTRSTRDRWLLAAIGLAIGTTLSPTASATASGDQPGITRRLRVSTGYDTYTHTYHLATDDTTETIGEFNVGADIEVRSAPRALHQWHMRAELNLGSQLFRELVDIRYRWRPDRGDPRVRADLVWSGRQHRPSSEHALSSDNHETRGELRLCPWRSDRRIDLELRLRTRILEHRRPSVLEQDQRDLGGAVFLTSRGDISGVWSIGLLAMQRAYPDSAAINRRTYGVEGQLERSSHSGDFWIYHRSDRRRTAEPEVRPSAWMHWTEARLTTAAGSGRIVTNLTSEVWRYERQTSVWYDAWRSNLEVGYRWGDLFSLQRHLLVAAQHLAAGHAPEAHTQAGLCGSIEGHGSNLSGILALELGRRWYRHPKADETSDLGEGHDILLLSYSDFTYLELWIMATWEISERMSLELTASYQPEHHTERSDNLTLGYGSLRFVWRP